MKRCCYIVLTLFLVALAQDSLAQETVFALLKSDKKRADEYFREKNFESALKYYSVVSERKNVSPSLMLQIAESSFFLKKYQQAVNAYEIYLKANSKIPENSLFQLAEACVSLGDHAKALAYYKKYIDDFGPDPIVLKKIWRIDNIQFLFEDSSHFAVRPLAINSKLGDLFGQPLGKGFLFLSNRKDVNVVQKVDGTTNKPLHQLYYSPIIADSAISGALTIARPAKFQKTNFKFHVGPFAAYYRQSKMVVTVLEKNSKLVFAEKVGNAWVTRDDFPFNSDRYSVSDPAISEEGTVLYFASDMPGGYGGKDLYRSILQNGKWSKPVNLGETINTRYDEISPFIYKNSTLYFSSNGQAGLGGLDIFKADILGDEFDEPKNLGYPVNSKLDDFGVSIDSSGQRGFFTSNRESGEFDDDLYEFEMDLQTYPLVINGTLRYREHNWNDSAELVNFARARLVVIDAVRELVVYEHTTDPEGRFNITIPYFSMYKIRVIGEDKHENVVSLDLPKHRKEESEHDIVVVKDAFKTPDSNQKE
ncbi:MAG TPA: tetratricopeptide repeat protein [Chryseosolibacter sp.]